NLLKGLLQQKQQRLDCFQNWKSGISAGQTAGDMQELLNAMEDSRPGLMCTSSVNTADSLDNETGSILGKGPPSQTTCYVQSQDPDNPVQQVVTSCPKSRSLTQEYMTRGNLMLMQLLRKECSGVVPFISSAMTPLTHNPSEARMSAQGDSSDLCCTCNFSFCYVALDIPLAQKLDGSLLKIYRQDDYPYRMFLAYKVCMTKEGHPWISPVVHRTRLQISQDPSLDYEYLPMRGMESFIQATLELLFGKHSQAIAEKRVGGVHTVGESGAFQLGAQFLRMWRKNLKTVCIVSCQKEQYGLIFQDMGFTVYEYCIWNPMELCLDPSMFFDVMEHIPADSILVIGNIVDFKFTQNQWTNLMSIIKSKHIFPFFDIPCQGLSTGDLEEDTRLLQYFVILGFEFFCSQFLSKSFSIY
ncbi:hypothetical protein STEG23_020411, partial [Scotinomys teguina]